MPIHLCPALGAGRYRPSAYLSALGRSIGVGTVLLADRGQQAGPAGGVDELIRKDQFHEICPHALRPVWSNTGSIASSDAAGP